MGRRFLQRRTGGQFTRATLANTFGLGCLGCLKCHSLNPWTLASEPRPTHCHACGAALEPESATEPRKEGE